MPFARLTAIYALALLFFGCSAEGGSAPGGFSSEFDAPTPEFVAEAPPTTLAGTSVDFGQQFEAPYPIASIDKIGASTYAITTRRDNSSEAYLWDSRAGFTNPFDSVISLDREHGLAIVVRDGSGEFFSERFGGSTLQAPATRPRLQGNGYVVFHSSDGWVSYQYDDGRIRETLRREGKLLPGEKWLLAISESNDASTYELVDIQTGEVGASYQASNDTELFHFDDQLIVRDGSDWVLMDPENQSVDSFQPQWESGLTPARPLGYVDDASNYEEILAYRLVDDDLDTRGYWQGPGRIAEMDCEGLSTFDELGDYVLIQCTELEPEQRLVRIYDPESLTVLGQIDNSYGREASRDGSAIISVDPSGGAISWTPEGVTEIPGRDFVFSSKWDEASKLVGTSLVWIKADGEPITLPAPSFCDYAWASVEEEAFAFYVSENAALALWRRGADPVPLVRGAVCAKAYPSPDLERGISVDDFHVREWSEGESREAIRADGLSTRTWGDELVSIKGREPIIGRDELSSEEIQRREEAGLAHLGWLYSTTSGEWVEFELEESSSFFRRGGVWTARIVNDDEIQRAFGYIDDGPSGAVNLGPGDLDVLETQGEAWLVRDGTNFQKIERPQ